MAAGSVAAFWAVSFLLVVTPGADWAYAIAAGLRHGTVLPAVAGLLVGQMAVAAAVAAGVATLVARSPLVLVGLTTAGAVYLVWSGIGILRRPPHPAAGHGGVPDPWVDQVVRGAGVSGLNPKVFLLFLALVPPFTTPGAAWPVAVQVVVLGLVHTASCAVVYTAVGAGARRVSAARPAVARVVSRVSGTTMIAIGVVLLAGQLAGAGIAPPG
jgi:threonine/homoserine/homoserine lactone efflux protein